MMIYFTGDLHGSIDIGKLSSESLEREQIEIGKDDYLVVCGDFGLVWSGSEHERRWIDWLSQKPWTTLFVDGNHENFDMLESHAVEEWRGGKIHRITDKILHLMRGELFNLEGSTLFAFGGASTPSFDKVRRTKGVSWWPQELPSQEELKRADETLRKCGYTVDYVATHCAPSNIQARINLAYSRDQLTEYLQYVSEHLIFKKWLFGHYHEDRRFFDGYRALYRDIIAYNDAGNEYPANDRQGLH